MRRIVPGLTLLLLLLIPRPVGANSAPLRPTGPTLQPMEATQVRMEHERIEMHVQRAEPLNQMLLANIRVVFRFQPEKTETMTAGFPLQPSRIGEESLRLAYRITQFSAQADGAPLPHTQETIQWQGQSVDWAVYTLSFVEGQPMELEVLYEIEFFPGKGFGAPVMLHYILQTGALWAGTIGKTEAVVTFDRPLTADDVLAGTTDGWRVQDGALFWEWQDFEPDFDIAVVLANRFWLDLPAEVEALLARGALSRQELLYVHGALLDMFGENLHVGYWWPVAGGKLSGEAAIELLPQALEATRAVMAGDRELQMTYLHVLRASLFRQESGPAQLVNPDLFRLYIAEAQRLQAEGVSPVTRGSGDEMEWWAWFAFDTFYGTDDAELRELALRPIQALMPTQFMSEADAEAWVEKLFRFPGYQLPPVLPEGLKEAVTIAAQTRVDQAETTPAVASAPVAVAERPPLRLTTLLLVAGAAAAAGSAWILYRRRVRNV